MKIYCKKRRPFDTMKYVNLVLVLVTPWSLFKEQRRKTSLNNIPENQPESTSTLAKWNTIMFSVLDLV